MDDTDNVQMQQSRTQRVYLKREDHLSDKYFKDGYKEIQPKAIRDLGVAVMVLACMIIALQAVDLGMRGGQMWWYGYILVGIWGGIVYFVTGAIGISGYEKPSRKILIIHLTMSIFSAAFISAALIGMSIVCLVMANEFPQHVCHGSRQPNCNHLTGVRAVNIILIILGAAQTFLNIISASLCCWTFSQPFPGWKVMYITAEPPEDFKEDLDFYPGANDTV